MGCAKFFGDGQFFFTHINGNNASRTGNAGTLNGVQANAPSTNDDNVLSGTQISSVNNCPNASDHATCNQAGSIFWNVM